MFRASSIAVHVLQALLAGALSAALALAIAGALP